jgi:hypothetical protein
MATAVTITPDAAPASAVTITPDAPLASRSEALSRIPFAAPLAAAVDKLREAENFTQEGRAAHPIQAKLGDLANRIEAFFFGTSHGEAAIGTGKYGMLTHPITSALMPGGEGSATGQLVEDFGKAVSSIPSLAGKAKAAWGASGAAEAGRAVTQTLAPETANAALSSTRGATTAGGAATRSITNQDVIQHAADMGIKLTPAQALQTSAARSEQVFGEEALLTGGKIKEAAAVERSKLADQVSSFQDKIDPQRVGMSAEAAGEHLQNSAEISRSVLKDNVNRAYTAVKEQQADLAGDAQGPLQKLIHDETFVRQPHAAVEQPVFQTSAAKAAIKDIQEMLADPAMQGRQSVQSLRNLRTTLLEKGNDYGANALSDSGQRIYKLAASQVDGAILDAAKGTPFEQTFREAGQQNAKLQTLYNQKGSPLYRILNTDDPAAVTNGILNRSSVHEIEALKGENFDLGPLARQAVEDIKDGGFRVTPSGLGGYPDTFLRSLLGPDATKDIYMKAEIARRLTENYNPSGSGKVVLGASQVLHPIAAVAAQAARVRSMPQAAVKYLPKVTGRLADMAKP